MATVLDKAQSRKRIAEIRQLWNEWDPIGIVGGSGPDDEYDGYLAPRCDFSSGTHQPRRLLLTSSGLPSNMALSQVASPEDFAERLRQWFNSKWKDTHVPGA